MKKRIFVPILLTLSIGAIAPFLTSCGCSNGKSKSKYVDVKTFDDYTIGSKANGKDLADFSLTKMPNQSPKQFDNVNDLTFSCENNYWEFAHALGNYFNSSANKYVKCVFTGMVNHLSFTLDLYTKKDSFISISPITWTTDSATPYTKGNDGRVYCTPITCADTNLPSEVKTFLSAIYFNCSIK